MTTFPIKSCPFCGKDSLSLSVEMNELPNDEVTLQAICGNCKARGPLIKYDPHVPIRRMDEEERLIVVTRGPGWNIRVENDGVEGDC